jgi:hypothetical protein
MKEREHRLNNRVLYRVPTPPAFNITDVRMNGEKRSLGVVPAEKLLLALFPGIVIQLKVMIMLLLGHRKEALTDDIGDLAKKW